MVDKKYAKNMVEIYLFMLFWQNFDSGGKIGKIQYSNWCNVSSRLYLPFVAQNEQMLFKKMPGKHLPTFEHFVSFFVHFVVLG